VPRRDHDAWTLTLGYNTSMFGLFRRQDPHFRDDGNFLLARVLTDRNREEIRVRLSKTSEMSAQGGGYFVRKVLLGPKSLDQAILEVTTNRSHKVLRHAVDGGKLVPVREWDA
jgi:hypothetical protein